MAFTEKQNNPVAVGCVGFFVWVFFLLPILNHWIQQLRIIHDSKLLLSLLVRDKKLRAGSLAPQPSSNRALNMRFHEPS